MKAIILAAGSGTRISKDFPELPKALIQVNNNSIISRQISTFKKNGIDEIIVITSTFKEKFSTSDVTYVDDQKFEEHDILGSLMELSLNCFTFNFKSANFFTNLTKAYSASDLI